MKLLGAAGAGVIGSATVRLTSGRFPARPFPPRAAPGTPNTSKGSAA